MADQIDHTAEAVTCQAHVSDGTFLGHTCGRPVKEDGLCGRHLAGRKRSMSVNRSRRLEDERHRLIRAEIEALLAEHGISGYAQRDPVYSSRVTGSVVIARDELKRILGDPS